MTLPPAIHTALETRLGTAIETVVPLSGGMINQVARVETQEGPILVKWHLDAPPGMFAAEADGLCALAATNTIRVPAVLLHDDDTRFLALEFLPPASVADPHRFMRTFAHQLALLHRQSAASGPLCGWEIDNYLGVYPQPNTARTPSWATFYREYRLLPQITRAAQAGHLSADRERLLKRVVDNLEALLIDLPPEMSLVHGDLWSGNFLALADDVPALIDPAVYYGPREMELAYIELFGGFPPGFVEAYRDAWPLSPTYERRRSLHQLYPLLVHLNCFGEKYGPWVERACHEALS